MIRFIDIGCQTGNSDEGIKEFCFFDTQRDRFLLFNNECCWTCKDDFIEDFKKGGAFFFTKEILRFTDKIPVEFNKQSARGFVFVETPCCGEKFYNKSELECYKYECPKCSKPFNERGFINTKQ